MRWKKSELQEPTRIMTKQLCELLKNENSAFYKGLIHGSKSELEKRQTIAEAMGDLKCKAVGGQGQSQ
jgi:hypothetical protein